MSDLKKAIAACVLRLSTRLGNHPYTNATFPGMNQKEAQQAALNAWVEDMARGLRGTTPEAFSKAVEMAADGHIRFWNEFSPVWIKNQCPAQPKCYQLNGPAKTSEEAELERSIETHALRQYQTWRYQRMAQLSMELGPEPMKELQRLRDPPPDFTEAKMAEFRQLAQRQLKEAGPSVAKLEAVSVASRAAGRYSAETRSRITELQRRLNLIPHYEPGEIGAKAQADLDQTRIDLQAQISALQNPTPEQKAQRIKELEAEIKNQAIAPPSSGPSSAAQIINQLVV